MDNDLTESEYEVYSELCRLRLMFENAVRDIAEQRSRSIKEIALIANMPESTLRNLLNFQHTPSLKTIVKLGLALGVRWDFVGRSATDSSKVEYASKSVKEAIKCG
jgi:transcriptional regulator with XRE-family HTH domain